MKDFTLLKYLGFSLLIVFITVNNLFAQGKISVKGK